MDSAFDDEDIFRQFDYHPPNRITTNSARQSISKEDLIDILDIVKSSLERAWFSSCGGKKRRLKRMETLEELKQKIESCPDDMNLSMVLENAFAPTSCVPPLFGRNMNRVLERQLNHTLLFLDEHLNTGEETDDATIGDTLVEDDEELEMMTAHSHNTSDSSSVYTAPDYDADSEKIDDKSQSAVVDDDDDGVSEGSDDVVVTTCNVESDLGPLGVSITTWSRRKLNTESMRSRSTIAEAVAEAERTSESDDEDEDDDDDDEENNETLEEVSVSIGDKVVVHASRTRSVRFIGIKPTTEDNIHRAMELLQSAKLMREKMVESP